MKPINAYVMTIAAVAVAVIALLDWSALVNIPPEHWAGFLALVALGLFSESQSVKTAVGDTVSNFTITFIPLLTGVLLFGAAPAVALFVVVGLTSEFLIHRKPPVRAVFNSAQYAVSSFAAGSIYLALLYQSGIDEGALLKGTEDPWNLLLPILAFGFVFLTINHALVAGAIAIHGRVPFRRIWSDLTGPSAANIVVDLLVSPVALGVAFLYRELQLVGLLLILFPMLFIRHFYLINYRLSRANQDLLRVLVKAIETRDPYTAGHSMRVANLAQEIARAMGLGERKIARVEQSARLHDIGKIDAIYTEILKKPDSLSMEERGIIESHVTKGVELLQELSSVSHAVIADVRHHHERVDGRGYPDGLKGDAIPIGARIIKVADAIDAMLSDRPYRRALDLATVRRELETYAGSQFDPAIVAVVVTSDVLERHQEAVRSGAIDELWSLSGLPPQTEAPGVRPTGSTTKTAR